jgi:hypothetical protein
VIRHALGLLILAAAAAVLIFGNPREPGYWALLTLLAALFLVPTAMEAAHKRTLHTGIWTRRVVLVALGLLVFAGWQAVQKVPAPMQSPDVVVSNMRNPLDGFDACKDGSGKAITNNPGCPGYVAPAIDPGRSAPLTDVPHPLMPSPRADAGPG